MPKLLRRQGKLEYKDEKDEASRCVGSPPHTDCYCQHYPLSVFVACTWHLLRVRIYCSGGRYVAFVHAVTAAALNTYILMATDTFDDSAANSVSLDGRHSSVSAIALKGHDLHFN